MSNEMIELLIKSFWETGYMVVASTVLASLIGIPLGIILTVTRSGHILPNAVINSVLGVIVNATRSTPFIILMVAIIPLTRMLLVLPSALRPPLCRLPFPQHRLLRVLSNLRCLKLTTALSKPRKAWVQARCRLFTRFCFPNRCTPSYLALPLRLSPYRLLCHGGRTRRRRPRRPCHPLRLPAFPA